MDEMDGASLAVYNWIVSLGSLDNLHLSIGLLVSNLYFSPLTVHL